MPISPNSSEEDNSPASHRGFRMLGTGLLIAGSALFGGLAVALWDRKSLAKLRQPPPKHPATVQDERDE